MRTSSEEGVLSTYVRVIAELGTDGRVDAETLVAAAR
jgi:hypothetical protein